MHHLCEAALEPGFLVWRLRKFQAGGENQTAYQDMVQAVVNYCNSNNAYVDLDLHWSGTSERPRRPAEVDGEPPSNNNLCRI